MRVPRGESVILAKTTVFAGTRATMCGATGAPTTGPWFPQFHDLLARGVGIFDLARKCSRAITPPKGGGVGDFLWGASSSRDVSVPPFPTHPNSDLLLTYLKASSWFTPSVRA